MALFTIHHTPYGEGFTRFTILFRRSPPLLLRLGTPLLAEISTLSSPVCAEPPADTERNPLLALYFCLSYKSQTLLIISSQKTLSGHSEHHQKHPNLPGRAPSCCLNTHLKIFPLRINSLWGTWSHRTPQESVCSSSGEKTLQGHCRHVIQEPRCCSGWIDLGIILVDLVL